MQLGNNKLVVANRDILAELDALNNKTRNISSDGNLTTINGNLKVNENIGLNQNKSVWIGDKVDAFLTTGVTPPDSSYIRLEHNGSDASGRLSWNNKLYLFEHNGSNISRMRGYVNNQWQGNNAGWIS